MTPILSAVAREYSRRYNDLKNICFLFPNKRCGVFFKKYLASEGVISENLPHILTISEFMSQTSRLREASKMDQLFTLFNCYNQILAGKGNQEEDTVDFASFKGWGETVLSDFHIVDMYLANPDEIFKNVKDFRAITSNFLSEDQKDVMREYFGLEEFDKEETFWKQFNDPDKLSPLKSGFLNLWQILSPLHRSFIKSLKEKSTSTSGNIYREAVERVRKKGQAAIPYKKIVAVGFNALNEAERSLFKLLKDQEGYEGFDEYIDFIWDATGPILNDKSFSASRFVNYNKKHFPEPEWWKSSSEDSVADNFPEIQIIAAPSLTSQTQVAAKILEGYHKPEDKSLIADARVALVLPDESLLSNMLYSFPDDIGDINLTMGVSLKQTSIASFISTLRRIYSTSNIGKTVTFFTKDLKFLFSHPYISFLVPLKNIENLDSTISEKRKIRISLDEVGEIAPELKILLDFPDKKSDSLEVLKYLKSILSALSESMSNSGSSSDISQDVEQIGIYYQYAEQLENSIKEYGISTDPLTLFHLIDRLISSEKIGFEGEPLSGLQVMGTLETRCLDFDHVIILSMNEGIMPRKANAASFIPDSLRQAYGLPPARYAEEIFAYYFFRLISRPQKVTLIYDGRTISGLRGGESRYLLQLDHFAPSHKLKKEAWQYLLLNPDAKMSSVVKNEEIKEKLKDFCKEGEGSKNLSASSLNSYRECGIKFLLKNVLDIDDTAPNDDFIDAVSTGNIVHEVMMRLYLPEDMQHKFLYDPVIISREFLDQIVENPGMILSLVVESINSQLYFQKEKVSKMPESGVIEILASQLAQLVTEIVKYDRNLAPFKLYGCEITRKLKVKMPSGRTVNFKFAIDRLDEITVDGQQRIRIVDYKTGSRKRSAGDLEEVFLGNYKSEQLFQLFTYAWLLNKLNFKGAEDVVTEIYYVPDLVSGTGGLPEIGGEKVGSYARYREEFEERLVNLVESIFDFPEFTPPLLAEECSYCAYRSLCLQS